MQDGSAVRTTRPAPPFAPGPPGSMISADLASDATSARAGAQPARRTTMLPEPGRQADADEAVAQPAGARHPPAGFEQVAEAEELQNRQGRQHRQPQHQRHRPEQPFQHRATANPPGCVRDTDPRRGGGWSPRKGSSSGGSGRSRRRSRPGTRSAGASVGQSRHGRRHEGPRLGWHRDRSCQAYYRRAIGARFQDWCRPASRARPSRSISETRAARVHGSRYHESQRGRSHAMWTQPPLPRPGRRRLRCPRRQPLPPREPKPATRYDASAYQAGRLPRRRRCGGRLLPSASGRAEAPTGARRADLAVAAPARPGPHGDRPVAGRRSASSSGCPPASGCAWWIDHILQDRRFADYLAERLARACVGTEDGPFIFYPPPPLRRPGWATRWRRTGPTTRSSATSSPPTGCGPTSRRPTSSPSPQEADKNQPDPVRLAGRVTRAFLGLRLDCAQCHNHPFADWKQADFQGLAAFFGQTHVGFTGIHDGTGEYEVDGPQDQASARPSPRACPSPRTAARRQAAAAQQLARWVTAPEESLLRPRRRQPRLGADAGPAAGRARGRPASPTRLRRRPADRWPTTSPPTATTCAD